MEYRLFVVAAVAFLFVCQYLARSLTARWSYRRAMRKHGCEPILKYPHTDRVLGTDLAEKLNKARNDGDLMKRWPEIYKAAGGKTFEANIVGKKTLMTMDSKNIQTITATQLERFRVEPTRGRMSNGWWGKGVFFSDDPHWSIGRKTIKPIFLRSQIGDLSGFGKHVSRMIKLIPRDGSTVDLQDLVLDMFMDSSNEWLFGYSSETLDNGPRSVEARQLLAALNVVRASAVGGLTSGPIAIIKNFFLGDKKLEAAKREIDSQIDKYISHALERRERASTFPDKLSSPLSSFIFIDQLVNQTQDRKFIRDQLMSVWIGSQDTSGLGACSIIFFLARYKKVWTKLRSKVFEQFGVDQAITFEELKSIRYLQWVMNEALRLRSPVNRSVRTCSEDCVLPRGGGVDGQSPILVPSGTMVDTNFGQLHRDKDIWGEDADEFRPERWENIKPMWDYVPFLGGPRMCPAQQQALTHMGHLLVRLTREFEIIENRDEVFEFVEEHVASVKSRNGVKVAFP